MLDLIFRISAIHMNLFTFQFVFQLCMPMQYTMFTFNTTTDQLNRDESIIEADYLVADYYKIMIGQLIGLCQLVLFCRSPVPTHFRNVFWGW